MQRFCISHLLDSDDHGVSSQLKHLPELPGSAIAVMGAHRTSASPPIGGLLVQVFGGIVYTNGLTFHIVHHPGLENSRLSRTSVHETAAVQW